jgi:seryl-tRNA synthetase
MYVMLDITFIRENRDIVAKAIRDKKTAPVDLDLLIVRADQRKELKQRLSELNRERNQAAQERNIEKGKELKDQAQRVEEELARVEKEFISLMIQIPNIPSPDTPIGPDESGNKVIRQWGEKPTFNFEPKAHWDIGKDLNIIDTDSAGEISGARFSYLMGDLVLMQFALIKFVFEVLTNKETLDTIAEEAGLTISTKSFIPMLPPVMIKSAVMNRMARLHPIEERYFFEKDDLVLIGSAEHTMGPLFMDKIIEEKDLPIRYIGYSTAFRREAGAYGKDTKGILRQHQFDKIEMETFCLPEHSYQEQDFLVAIQEYLLRKLKIHHQTVLICTGDMGGPDHRQIDIECWMPGQGVFRETHSADLMQGYQSRRLNTRVRRTDGKIEHVHMNDATALALGRTLIAIIENYQQADGSITIPEVLRSYMSKDVISKRH